MWFSEPFLSKRIPSGLERVICAHILLLSPSTSSVNLGNSVVFQGSKLWIIMEYLGGGSALDLVSVQLFSGEYCGYYTVIINIHHIVINIRLPMRAVKLFNLTRQN